MGTSRTFHPLKNNSFHWLGLWFRHSILFSQLCQGLFCFFFSEKEKKEEGRERETRGKLQFTFVETLKLKYRESSETDKRSRIRYFFFFSTPYPQYLDIIQRKAQLYVRKTFKFGFINFKKLLTAYSLVSLQLLKTFFRIIPFHVEFTKATSHYFRVYKNVF